MDAKLLEGMDEGIASLVAAIKRFRETHERDKERTAEAARALSLSPHDQKLQLLHRHAKENEENAEKFLAKEQQNLKKTLHGRQAMEDLQNGADLTLYEAVLFPLLLLGKCSSPEGPIWEAQLTQPMTQTCGEVLPWPEFGQASHELLDSLDDSMRKCGRPEFCSGRLGGRVQRAELQDEVRMRLSRFMESVNDAAKEHGIPVQCCGGSERCMSQAEMVMRPAGAHSELASMSKHILGVVLVTCSLQLERGERLEDALRDPLRTEELTALLQRAYADAVLDEAPLLVLTEYNVTVFLRRSGDVKDTRLWASEPVWADQREPPARAAWLNGLQEAHKLRSLKQSLPRTHVPHPLEKRQTQPCQQQTETLRQHAASESLVATEQSAAFDNSAAPSRKRKRADEQLTEEPSAPDRAVRHHLIASGMPQQATSPASSNDGMYSHSSPAAQLAAPGATNQGAEETLLLSDLGLTDEHVVGDPYGYTYKGTWAGKPVAVKVYNLRKDGAPAAYEREKLAYKGLEALQGVAIPHFLRSGVLAHTASPVIVSSYEGTVLDLDKPVPEHLHQAMEEALEALHAAGAAHCDVNISKFVVNGDAVRLVDFERLALKATEEQKEYDMRALNALLPY